MFPLKDDWARNIQHEPGTNLLSEREEGLKKLNDRGISKGHESQLQEQSI